MFETQDIVMPELIILFSKKMSELKRRLGVAMEI